MCLLPASVWLISSTSLIDFSVAQTKHAKRRMMAIPTTRRESDALLTSNPPLPAGFSPV